MSILPRNHHEVRAILVEFIGTPWVDITRSRRIRASSSFTSTPQPTQESRVNLVKLRLRFQRSKLESSGTSTTSDHRESARKIPRKSGGLATPEQLHPKAFPIRQRFHQTKDLYIDHFQTERCNLNRPKTFR